MIRLYIGDIVFLHGLLTINDDKVIHHLRNVKRVSLGDKIILFNAKQGEILTHIHILTKKQIIVRFVKFCASKLNPNTSVTLPTQLANDPSADKMRIFTNLIFSPIKREDVAFIAEKATELGVDAIFPAKMQYTVVNKISIEKIRRSTISAVEQSHRLHIPYIQNDEMLYSLSTLGTAINTFLFKLQGESYNSQIEKNFQNHNAFSHIFIVFHPKSSFMLSLHGLFSNEVLSTSLSSSFSPSCTNVSITDGNSSYENLPLRVNLKAHMCLWAFFGPEGGFGDKDIREIETLAGDMNARIVYTSICDHILRSETAIISGLAIIRNLLCSHIL